MKIELGKRIREFRKKSGNTQDDLAEWLGLSRSSVAQMELGNRDVDSVELERIADFFGCDPLAFFKDEPVLVDSIAVLFRANADLEESTELRHCVSGCMKLGREVANLRDILDIETETNPGILYELRAPQNKWDAVEQGNRIAEQERRRLELGHLPVTDLVKLIESQGICTGQHKMPPDVSGFTILDRTGGYFIFVNENHRGVRKRFSFAHEYGHVIMDSDRSVSVSRLSKSSELLEVRANAFAACFLVPEEGCQGMIRKLGKGAPSREEISVYDGEGSLTIQKRNIRSEQSIQLYDAARLAYYFGVSLRSMLYRLKNLNYLTKTELDEKLQDEAGFAGTHLRNLMMEKDICNRLDEPDLFRLTVFNLALEAYKRSEISKGKCLELTRLARLDGGDVLPILYLIDKEEFHLESEEP